MSPRRNRRDVPDGDVDLDRARRKVEAVEEGPDGSDWYVRHIPGHAATKLYRCPGCDHEIGVGVPHVVAWQIDGPVDERRHWHTGCWRARGRRGPRAGRHR